MLRVAALTTAAMLAFAANSVLARLALIGGGGDGLGYTGVRLASGAAALAVIWTIGAGFRPRALRKVHGSWPAAAALLGYAVAFSIAYLMLGAGTGALILFASMQIGMLGWAMWRGDRPGAMEWLGFAIAFAAFAYLVAPGAAAPAPAGAALMAAAGLCWAAYTLLGRGSSSPLAETAGNFIRCLPAAVVLLAAGAATRGVSAREAALAAASGALASGVGYAIWYAVLPSLSRTRAAFVQLTVPAIAAVGGALLIGEPLTLRLALSAAGVLGGVAIALAGGARRAQPQMR